MNMCCLFNEGFFNSGCIALDLTVLVLDGSGLTVTGIDAYAGSDGSPTLVDSNRYLDTSSNARWQPVSCSDKTASCASGVSVLIGCGPINYVPKNNIIVIYNNEERSINDLMNNMKDTDIAKLPIVSGA